MCTGNFLLLLTAGCLSLSGGSAREERRGKAVIVVVCGSSSYVTLCPTLMFAKMKHLSHSTVRPTARPTSLIGHWCYEKSVWCEA